MIRNCKYYYKELKCHSKNDTSYWYNLRISTLLYFTRLASWRTLKSQQILLPVPVAVQCKAQAWRSSPVEIVVSNPAGYMDVCCKCCVFQVVVSATSWSIVQRSPIDNGASLCVIYKLQDVKATDSFGP